MKKWFRKLFAVALLTSLLVNYTLSATASALAQSSASQWPDSHLEAIKVVAKYFNWGDTVTPLLHSYGYIPSVPREEWRGFPASEKIHFAYIAAERAKPNRGGSKLLALLSQDLAQKFESVRSAPVLDPFLSQRLVTRSIKFINPPRRTGELKPLPKGVAKAIDKLAEYFYAANRFGTPESILMKHFKLTSEQANEAWSRGQSYAEAFKLALSDYVSKEKWRDVVVSLAYNVSHSYVAAKDEPAIKPYLQRQAPSVTKRFAKRIAVQTPLLTERVDEINKAKEEGLKKALKR